MNPLIARRMSQIDASGIRKVFDLAAKMQDPVNLSIGQPHFDTPDIVKAAMKQAVDEGRNAYSQSQGTPKLLNRLQKTIDVEYQHADRQVFVTSGTSGGLMLALCTLIDPGDEVLTFDPYFVMYKHLTTLAGGTLKLINTYPDFTIDLDCVRQAITPRTKLILFNSPSNPTGRTATLEEVRGLAELAQERNIALLSDEIYRAFCYDRPFVSPAQFNDKTIVIDSFSKSHSMTGWRVGWCHGPAEIIREMIKLQQFTFVCAPHPAQFAACAALDCDISDRVAAYKENRDVLQRELASYTTIHGGDGAFYLFLPAPAAADGTRNASAFVQQAIDKNLLVIPGNVFSPQDTHFRISFAAPPETIRRGIEILKPLLSATPKAGT